MFSFNLLFTISNKDRTHSTNGKIILNYDSLFKALNVLTRKVYDLINFHGYYNIKFEINGIDITDKKLEDFNVDEEQLYVRFDYLRHIIIGKTKLSKLALENKENYIIFFFNQYCKSNGYDYKIIKNWLKENNLFFYDNVNFIISKEKFDIYEKIIKIGFEVNFDIKNSEYTKFRNTLFDKYLYNKLQNCESKLENNEYHLSIKNKINYFKKNEYKFNDFSLKKLIDEFNKPENEFIVSDIKDDSVVDKKNIIKNNPIINKTWHDGAIQDPKLDADWITIKSPKPVNPRPHK